MLRAHSYVKIQTPVSIPVKLLQRLEEGPRRLTPMSYGELQARVVFSVPLGFVGIEERPAVPNTMIINIPSDDGALLPVAGNRVSNQRLLPQSPSKPPPRTVSQNIPRDTTRSKRRTRDRYPYYGTITMDPEPQISSSSTTQQFVNTSSFENASLPISQWPEAGDGHSGERPWTKTSSLLLLVPLFVGAVVGLRFWARIIDKEPPQALEPLLRL